jgi:hypothetical protein
LLITAIVIIGLLALALTVPLWFAPLLRFLTSNSADVQNLTNLAQLLLFAGSAIAVVVAIFRLIWQRNTQRETPAQPTSNSQAAQHVTQQIVVNIGEFERLASASAQSWASVSIPESRQPARDALPELRQRMTERINESELQNICFDLRIDYGLLPGQSYPDKVRELLTYLSKRNRLAELVTPLTQTNDAVDWASLLTPSARASRRDAVLETRRELAETVRRYFEYLADEHKYLRFKGMGLRQMPLNVPLLEVYVPLFARRKAGEGEREAYGRKLRVAGRALSDEEKAALGERFTERFGILDLLRQNKGLIICTGDGQSDCLARWSGRSERFGTAQQRAAAGGQFLHPAQAIWQSICPHQPHHRL